jgi:hypothetical protein
LAIASLRLSIVRVAAVAAGSEIHVPYAVEDQV